ncbi:hypothetical protein EB118_02090 [bacterium]|nr:hypothetical protein [bacterium]NDC93900.1 hypothetical protein [bacterium]NDD83266.1 hypothetical protein [bacterium]NDG28878.1 hypothetical protein [bacterium]
METRNFAPLYSRDSRDRVKEWTIKVMDKGEFSVIEWSFGYTNAKKITYTLQLNSGKNIGRSNATGHFEQAVLEAQSRWKKKVELEGYYEMSDTLVSGMSSLAINDTIYPMLAQDYLKHSKKVIFPCYIQPKLDGYRMIYQADSKSVTSRTGKDFAIIRSTELYRQLQELHGVVLDGELYLHDIPFESLGVVRKKKVNKVDREMLESIQYHVYDIIDVELPFSERLRKLKSMEFASKIRIVPTYICSDISDIAKYHLEFTQAGYEGSIIRNAGGMYRKKFRSTDLLKKKDFMDGEYEVVGYSAETDSKSSKQLVVWECITDKGIKFHVRPQGTEIEREYLFNNAAQWIGKKLWVKFFELTDKDVPRFPSTKTASYTSYFRTEIV